VRVNLVVVKVGSRKAGSGRRARAKAGNGNGSGGLYTYIS